MPESKVNHIVGLSKDDATVFVRRGKSIYKTMEPHIAGHESEVRFGNSKDFLETYKGVICSPETQKHLKAWHRRATRLGITCRDCGACCVCVNGKGMTVNACKDDEAIDVERINAIRPGSLVRDACGEYVMSFVKVDDVLDVCPFWHKEQGCSIYNERPRVCKTFTAGNWACLRVRAVCLPHLDRAHLMSDKERAFYKKHESKRNWARWMTLD